MSSVWWTSLFVLLAIFGKAKCESTAFPVIPEHLLECYMDDGIYHRANRMPSTIESFLDLLRKVENSPTSRNMNARELATALLHYLKLDGIQSIQTHTKYQPSNILPFAPSGDEYFKHRLTLVGLVPRIDQSYMRAINESLTLKQMCNLHFMLSYSIDPYKRSDERCSPLFQETRTDLSSEPRSEWNPYQSGGSYYGRYRRHVRAESLNGLKAKSKRYGTDTRVIHESSKTKREAKDSKEDKKLEVEEIAVPQHLSAKGMHNQEEKDRFTIGNQELLSELPSGKGMQSLIQVGNFGRYGGRGFPKPMHSTDDTFYSGITPGIPLSECPVVNGVVTTRSGSLTIGTVIAGIAAGLNPEEIPPVKLSVDPKELESPSDRVKNIWATTLAGAVADVLSSSALLDVDNLQVLKGGWNKSCDPRWYLLSSNQFKHLPEVTLRGSLDGLIVGLNAKEWTGRFSGLKLSQMLQTYYQSSWGKVEAKYRVNLRPQYAPDDVFRKQVHLMSLVLKKQKTNVLTVLDYQHISNDAVRKVIQYIQMMDDSEKSSIGSYFSTAIDNSVNMIAVIDSSWGHENLHNIFYVLRFAEVALTMGNNLTIVCGKDGRVLMSSDNSADFDITFTKEMLQEKCPRGMNIPLVFDSLESIYRKIYYDEKTSLKMNTDAQVVVLFPFESPPSETDSYVIEKSRHFRYTFPDVRLMIASNGRSEGFLPLVDNPKDLFGLIPSDPEQKSYKEFAEGVKPSYQRISRPSCGSYFDDDTAGGDTQVTRDVHIGNIAYFRLLPQYFYTQHGQAVVSIRTKQGKPLTVCHSRVMDRPVGPSPRVGPVSDYNPNRSPEYSPDFPPEASLYGRQYSGESEGEVQCKTITSETYKIEMNNPCEGTSLRECHPLYISLFPPHQDTFSNPCINCRLPTDVQFEISVSGLTCYNSATTRFLAPILLFCLLCITLLNTSNEWKLG